MAASETGGPSHLGPIDFSTFIISLASNVLVHLGQKGPEGAGVEVNLPLARQTIEIIEMLESKTAGNLTDDEARVLSGVLYQVRVAYVEAQK